MKEDKTSRRITIKGIVTPADWDDDGKITAVVISTPLEEEYLVEDREMSEELLGLVGAEVVARGLAGSTKDGYRTIAVEKYELLADEEEEFEQDDEEYEGDWDFDEDSEFEEEEEYEYHEK